MCVCLCVYVCVCVCACVCVRACVCIGAGPGLADLAPAGLHLGELINNLMATLNIFLMSPRLGLALLGNSYLNHGLIIQN